MTSGDFLLPGPALPARSFFSLSNSAVSKTGAVSNSLIIAKTLSLSFAANLAIDRLILLKHKY